MSRPSMLWIGCNLLPPVTTQFCVRRRVRGIPQPTNFTQGLTLKRHIEATLGSGNIREAVQLPPGEDLNEWLAVNTVDFYNAISVLFGTLEEFCTVKTCPVMSAGPKVMSFVS